MDIDSMTSEFLAIVDVQSQLDRNDVKFFQHLLEQQNIDGERLMKYIEFHPEVLLCKIKNHFVFDFFYEKVISDRGQHPKHVNLWHDNLLKIVEILETFDEFVSGVGPSGGAEVIKQDKKYILRLQSTNKTLTGIFRALIQAGFDMGDSEFLVYSLIARGELPKLKVLAESYVVEDYPGVLDVALRYGRLDILIYFLEELKLDIRLYGKILDFENYIDNVRYVYYQEQLTTDGQELQHKHRPPIQSSSNAKQDYVGCLKLLLEDYEYEITLGTLEIWCQFIRDKLYIWDMVNATEVFAILKKYVKIPLTHDFKEFNMAIFGEEWSDRNHLVEYCLQLEEKIAHLQDRYNIVSERLRGTQDRYEQICAFMTDREYARATRIRRETQ